MESERTEVVVDELAELDAVDPTYGGTHEQSALDEAYVKVSASLRAAYAQRYRHPVPQNDEDIFKELQAELVLPFEALIAKLIMTRRQEQRLTLQDRSDILAVADDFVTRLRHLPDL